MRAVVFDRYGPPEVLRLEDVERPAPDDDQALVRVRATTVTRTDAGLRSAEFFISRFFTGLLKPKYRTPGMEFAGEVAAIGASVIEFKIGDEVFGVKSTGANAEYVTISESGAVAPKPTDLTFEEAAAVCDGACAALSCLRGIDLGPGRRLAVYGASGSIGTAAVQVAKHFGAHVTAVCGTKNVELVRSLGADEVVDYQREDFTKNGVFDAVGKQSFRRCRRSLNPGGVFVTTDPGFLWHAPLVALLTRWIGDRRARLGIARYEKPDVLLLKRLLEAGEYRAVIDRTYRLEDVVEATRYVETGQKTGNVVLTLT
jgi:NADPH:quinone reductase-like Zn-dependent oxidoreductase